MHTAIRTIAGLNVPAPGTWTIDPGHADVSFVGRHFGLTKIRGRFTGVAGTVTFGESLTESQVDVTIAMGSVESGDAARDEHLRSADLFDAATFPEATFRSTAVEVDGATAAVHGVLTIKGISRPVTLDVDYVGHATDPWGNDRAVFAATTTINREDWDITWNMVLDAGGLLVSKQIKLEIDVELIRQTT